MKKALHLRLLDFLGGKTFLILVALSLATLAVWFVGLRPHATVIHTARSPDGHSLTLTFHRRGLNPMGSVIGRISAGDTVVSEMLLVDDETNPVPPRVAVTQVEWIQDGDLPGRCVIKTTSKGRAQRFVISYLRTVPGEFAHYPASAYTPPEK